LLGFAGSIFSLGQPTRFFKGFFKGYFQGGIMPRRREVAERVMIPDPKYNSELVAKFINSMLRDGKKSTAESLFYDAFDIIEKKTNEPPLKIFKQAIDNVKPAIEVKSRRVGGSSYQVPTEIRPSRRKALAIRWMIAFARKRSEKTMAQKLAAELLDAASKRGASVKKREDTHKMAEANKAFAHFRW
jgi:small subunit ribosomal protein S7